VESDVNKLETGVKKECGVECGVKKMETGVKKESGVGNWCKEGNWCWKLV
jgi:hypothetical protein